MTTRIIHIASIVTLLALTACSSPPPDAAPPAPPAPATTTAPSTTAPAPTPAPEQINADNADATAAALEKEIAADQD